MVMYGQRMSLTLTENRDFEADQLVLELDETDVMIVLPRRGFNKRWAGKVSSCSQRGIYHRLD
ncbi:hypothetical protein PI91_09620 [Enterobacter sp. FB]|jgi:hypothetical protein|nr:hypothetical protein PI91_09620 [Enterobacter sp. FB]OIR48938.1 hypothetical protein BH716_09720 [Lelliottia nimipressuralis]